MKKIVALTLLTVASSSLANVKNGKIIYGTDNRVEPFEANLLQKKLAPSTAGMISSVKLVENGDYRFLPPESIKNSMGLCRSERFSEQPNSVVCSGFLVAPDILVTAGHCIPNQSRCNEVSWVFDYHIKENSGRADMMIPKSRVFKCKKVISAKLESLPNGEKQDYAVIRLDRPVKNRRSLSFRTRGKIQRGDDIFVIGHPSGLPTKVAGDASVFGNDKMTYFETNLDTFGGNSGSAVFNAKNGQVEGILVRGAKDYVGSSGCLRVNQAPQNITGKKELGESVTRITKIPALKAIADLLEAARKGNVKQARDAVELLDDANITDQNYNSALQLAMLYGHVEVAQLLISRGADMDHQNFAGEKVLPNEEMLLGVLHSAMNDVDKLNQ